MVVWKLWIFCSPTIVMIVVPKSVTWDVRIVAMIAITYVNYLIDKVV